MIAGILIGVVVVVVRKALADGSPDISVHMDWPPDLRSCFGGTFDEWMDCLRFGLTEDSDGVTVRKLSDGWRNDRCFSVGTLGLA